MGSHQVVIRKMDELYPFVTELRRLIVERKTRLSKPIVSGSCTDIADYKSDTGRITGLEDAEDMISEILRDPEKEISADD